MYKFATLFLSLLLAVPAAAEEKQFDAEGRVKVVAPFLDDQTVAVAHFDASRIDADALAGKLSALEKHTAKEAAQQKDILRKVLDTHKKANVKDVFIVFSLADLPQHGPFAVVPLEANADERAVGEVIAHVLGISGGHEKIGPALVGGSPETRQRLKALKPTPRPEVARAFAAAGDTTAQFVVVPTADNRRVLEELLPRLPREVGGAAITTLTRGAMWIAVGADAPPKMTLRVTIQAENAKAAGKLREWVVSQLHDLGTHKEFGKVLPDFDKLAALLTPKVKDDRLTLALDDRPLTDVLVPLVQRVRANANRVQSANNLRQIGLAMHMYYDKHKHLPASASYDKQGKPLLSWRVHLLPFLEQNALYQEFHLDEPWDSPHNKKLIARLPPIYHCPSSKVGDEGKTVYLAPLGKQTMFPGPKGLLFRDVTDGLSNTILIVEAADDHGVIWTRPDDLKYNPEQPLKGLLGQHADGFNILLADGSVHFLSAAINPDTLRALFTRNGGEVVGPF
jgi:prepilin-type processing-associated H-X9-DG protein